MPCSLAQTMRYHYLDNIPYSKMCELCELCELFVKKSHRFAMGLSLFIRSRIYSLPSTSGTPEGQLEQPQASGTREALWNGPPLTRGVRGVLCFSGVVRLFERAEEGCEGLKHGCYDLPCVYFLSSLCHDIKNKIDRLVFK